MHHRNLLTRLPALLLALCCAAPLGLTPIAPASAQSVCPGALKIDEPTLELALALTDCAAYPQALLVLDALLRIDPFDVEAFVQAGKTLVLMEEYEQAEHYFRYALDYDQEHRIANLELGRLYIEAGFPDLAQQQLFILQEVCGSCAEHAALAAEIAAAAP
jgi:tetratricopeptide (TPR) repeat protein